ncbi:hypothetical protein M3661_13000 [Paenibacillus sp. MER 180]|uniref:hypothetical protein n=1 Tax=Paenibacillus sp. MER 180 TaxID=2939570 RepID=UPI00203F4558|nr:hypothetical protein [Paenibacillus sp. MER 180]MCM3291043.1 hypothetical protein [Paenibacillus sp. MER 180]
MLRKILPIVLLLSACSSDEGLSEPQLGNTPPQPEVIVNGESIQVYQSSYCWGNTCADYISPEEMLRDKEKETVIANSTIKFRFEGKQPTETNLSKFHNGAHSQVTISENSFQAPGEKGAYYYSLSATWLKDKEKRISEGSSSYVFVIEVQD